MFILIWNHDRKTNYLTNLRTRLLSWLTDSYWSQDLMTFVNALSKNHKTHFFRRLLKHCVLFLKFLKKIWITVFYYLHIINVFFINDNMALTLQSLQNCEKVIHYYARFLWNASHNCSDVYNCLDNNRNRDILS